MFMFDYEKYGELSKNEGYIYMLQLDDCIKIGITRRPVQRFTTHRAEQSKIFKVLVCILCNNYQAIENEVIYHYSKYVKKGREWMQMPEIEIKVLKVLIKHLALGNIDKIAV